MGDRSIVTLNVDVTEVTAELTREIEHWKETAARLQRHWEESEWYLGEARAAAASLEEQLRLLRAAYARLEAEHLDAAGRLKEAERQRNDINWALGQVQAERHTLAERTEALAAQLAESRNELLAARRLLEQAQVQLGGERSRCERIEAQLLAVHTYGERRRAFRKYRPDVTAELRADDGTVLFHGPPRDVSSTGLGFASEAPIHYLVEPLEVRLHFSTGFRPIDAVGRLVWQRQGPNTPRYFAGCELLEIRSDDHEALEQALAEPLGADREGQSA